MKQISKQHTKTDKRKGLLYRFGLLTTVLIFITLNTQAQPNTKIKWMKFTEAVEASKKEPRKIFIDIYASWCGWCHTLDNTTFKDQEIINILNEKFYPVKIDSDSREKLKFKEFDLTYAELAIGLGANPGENLGLPVMVFLDEKNDLLTRVPGYQKADIMKPILLFFAENHYKDKDWETYFNEYSAKEKTKRK